MNSRGILSVLGRAAVLVALFVFQSGCASIIGQVPSRENGYQRVEIDQVRSKVVFIQKDGSAKEKRILPGAKLVIDGLTGNILHYDAAFQLEGLFGLDLVPAQAGIDTYLLIGARVGYFGPWGIHTGISASTREGAENAMVIGLDYRRDNLILGVHLEQPFYLVNKRPIRPGISLLAPW